MIIPGTVYKTFDCGCAHEKSVPTPKIAIDELTATGKVRRIVVCPDHTTVDGRFSGFFKVCPECGQTVRTKSGHGSPREGRCRDCGEKACLENCKRTPALKVAMFSQRALDAVSAERSDCKWRPNCTSRAIMFDLNARPCHLCYDRYQPEDEGFDIGVRREYDPCHLAMGV